MRSLCLAIVIAIAGCASVRPLPSAHRPTPRALRVAVDASLNPWRPWVVRGVRMHQRAGVPVALVAGDAAADVVIRHGVDVATSPAAGMWYADRRVIELWPDQLRGSAQWSSCAAHEIAHALHAVHVCRPGERDLPGDLCSPVGRGLAVLNRQLQAPADECDPFEAMCDAGADEWFTLGRLDVLELRRVGALPPR